MFVLRSIFSLLPLNYCMYELGDNMILNDSTTKLLNGYNDSNINDS